MIIRHKDLVNKGYSAYQIKKLVEDKKLYFVKKGVYSTEKEINYFEMIAKKHPNAVYTLETAAYIYKLKKKWLKILKQHIFKKFFFYSFCKGRIRNINQLQLKEIS